MNDSELKRINAIYLRFIRQDSTDYIFGCIDGVETVMEEMGYKFDTLNKVFYKYKNRPESATAEKEKT